MQVKEKNKNGVTGLKVRRYVLTYLLVGSLMTMGFPSLIQAQEPHRREAPAAKEMTESEVGGARLQTPSPVVESAKGATTTPLARSSSASERLALLNTVKSLSRLSRPEFSAAAMRNPWQPIAQPQTSSGKKSKAGGLALGLFGLALAGAGGYWAAKSRPYEIVTPGFTSCTGIAPNRQCVEIPAKRTKTGVNPGMYAGIGLVGVGLGVAIAGFRRM